MTSNSVSGGSATLSGFRGPLLGEPAAVTLAAVLLEALSRLRRGLLALPLLLFARLLLRGLVPPKGDSRDAVPDSELGL